MERYLFRGATVVDGTGAPGYRGDVAVRDGLIAELGERVDPAGARVIDADGLVLAPGFIDIHGHSDMTVFGNPLLASKALQGVTLEVTGNCGLGLFPVADGRMLAGYLRLHDFRLPPGGIDWTGLDSWAGRIDREGIALHLAPLVGHAPLRIAVMGTGDRPPSSEEGERMARLLAAELDAGAWGLSTGLIYPPGSYADTGEIVRLAAVAAGRGALYASHIRGEGETIAGALAEAVRIGREAGVRVQVSHLKAMGSANRGKSRELLDSLEAARRSGVDIGTDQYPYNASATSLSAVAPAWAHDGGPDRLLERLRDPATHGRLVAEIREAMDRREGAANIVVTGCRTVQNRPFCGETVARIAAIFGTEPAEAVVRLLVEENGTPGAIFFSMAEEDVATILADPGVAVGSDGHALTEADDEPTHPRSFGTFPRVLGHYVREQKILTLETAVRKMTALPAARLGLADRGTIQRGNAADLVLFDPATVGEEATWARPNRYPRGIVLVMVAGRPVVRDGALTGERPGRVLRRGKSTGKAT